MVKISTYPFILSLLLILFITPVASVQGAETGKLTGTVTDDQGGVIPGAIVVAENALTGSKFRAVTRGTSVWEMPSVPGGSYTVGVTAQGFRSSTLKDVKVDPGAVAQADSTLHVGLANLVVVTASKYEEEVINAPATTSVILEPMILNSPSPNMGELLRSVPGMNVAQTSAREYNITSRAATGLFSGTQLALIDGRTIYHDDLGYLCWDGQATNLNDLKQVEVIRGPASAIWGSYAMNGIINIITKSPREMLGSTFTLGIGTFDRSGGSADSDRGSLYYVNATHAQALNERWAFKIGGGVFTQDAFARPQGYIPNPYHTPYPVFDNEGTTQPNVEGRVDYDLPDGRQHFIFSGGTGGTSGILHSQLGPVRMGSGYMKSYGKVDYLRNSLRITGYVNAAGGGTAKYLLLVDPTGQQIIAGNKNQTYHIELSDSRAIQAKHLISYGGNFRHNEFDLMLAPEADSCDEGGAYVQDEIVLSEHFRWVIGARVDKFEFLKGAVFSPRTTFIVKPFQGQTFRVSYNRAYMAPVILTRYIDMNFLTPIDLGLIDPSLAGNYYSFPMHFVGNKSLEEILLNAYEVGYSAIVANGRVNLGAAFYINDSKNGLGTGIDQYYTSENPPPGWPLPPFVLDMMIAAGAGLPSIMTYQNLGKVRNQGLELDVDARFNRYVSGYANYSWQARPEPKDFDISRINIPPEHRFNAGVDFNYKRYLGNVSVSYVDSAYWNDVIGPAYYGPTKAYTQVNVGGRVQWGENGRYTAMVKISNLANTPVQTHVFGDILKRQVSGELRVRFSK